MAGRRLSDRVGDSGGFAGKWILILFGAVILPLLSPSQSILAKEQRFTAAVESGDRAAAGSLLVELMDEDSSGIYRLAEAAEKLILPGATHNEHPAEAEIRRLARVYEMSARHDPAGPADWQVRQAMLALRFPATFAGRRRGLLRDAVNGSPNDCPLYLYEQWMELDIRALKDRELEVTVLALDWQEAADLLRTRQVLDTREAPATARLHQHLALRVRDALPDCSSLSSLFSSPPQADDCAAYLILHSMQNCDPGTGFWDPAFACASTGKPPAWIYRIAAARYLDGRDHHRARELWERACELEKDPARKAADLLDIAELLALAGEPVQSRTRIRQAMELHPAWGEPYFQLCDLYLESAPQCKFSPFDRKAIYWLAIDLCQSAMNADPDCEQEAAERIYRYKEQMPTAAETAFMGLSSGDSWPLRCWMSTITTVKTD